MLPPALFYVLGFVLVFFGALRVIFLGFKGPKSTPDEEQQVRTEKRGIGLLGLMGGGRMTAAKRHKVMGALWVVLGLYVAWTGVTMSRAQQLPLGNIKGTENQQAEQRVIRANVQRPLSDDAARAQPSGAPAGTREPPTLKAAPSPEPSSPSTP